MIKIIPFTHSDGIPSLLDSDIKGFYLQMVRDNTDKMVFHSGKINNEHDFLNMVKSQGILFFAAKKENTYVGMGWLNSIDQRAASCHFCVFSNGWGESYEIGKKLLDTSIGLKSNGNFLFDMFYGFVPKRNQVAIHFALKCGGKLLGYLPFGSYVQAEDKTEETAVIYYTR